MRCMLIAMLSPRPLQNQPSIYLFHHAYTGISCAIYMCVLVMGPENQIKIVISLWSLHTLVHSIWSRGCKTIAKLNKKKKPCICTTRDETLIRIILRIESSKVGIIKLSYWSRGDNRPTTRRLMYKDMQAVCWFYFNFVW